MHEFFDVLDALLSIYIIIGCFSNLIMFILYNYKNRYEESEDPLYILIWPKLYVILFKIIIQEIKEGRKK